MRDTFEQTIGLIADESRPVHTVSLTGLSDLSRGQVELFCAAWAGLSTARRFELVHTMVEQAESNIHFDFHAILRRCLADSDARVRRLAIEGLWEDNRPNLVDPLISLLNVDPEAEVRAAAATSLGRYVLMGVLGDIPDTYADRAVEALQAAWFRVGEVVQVRRRALEGLAYLGGAQVYALIDSAYYDEEELMRQSAVFAMGRSADRRWAKFILAELQSQDVAMRFEAAVSAGELGLPAALKPLIHLLDDADSNVREAAVLALGKVGGRDAQRALEACLESDDERLAEAAQEAIDELVFNRSSVNDLLMDYPEIAAQSRSFFGDDALSAEEGPGFEGEEIEEYDEFDDGPEDYDEFGFTETDEDDSWHDEYGLTDEKDEGDGA